MPRFISKTMHAYIDYPVALGLIAMPVLLGIGASNPMAFWLSVATGVAAFFLTLLTDHKTGLLKVLPYKLHLFWYFTVLGVTVLAVVGLHKPEGQMQVEAAAT